MGTPPHHQKIYMTRDWQLIWPSTNHPIGEKWPVTFSGSKTKIVMFHHHSPDTEFSPVLMTVCTLKKGPYFERLKCNKWSIVQNAWKWSAPCTSWYAIYLQVSDLTKNVIFLPYLSWNCPILTFQHWPTLELLAQYCGCWHFPLNSL